MRLWYNHSTSSFSSHFFPLLCYPFLQYIPSVPPSTSSVPPYLSVSSSDFLDTHIYLTRGWKDNQAFAIMLREGDEADAITGLQAKTHFGRPDWSKEFDSISLSHPKLVCSIHVHVCTWFQVVVVDVSHYTTTLVHLYSPLVP